MLAAMVAEFSLSSGAKKINTIITEMQGAGGARGVRASRGELGLPVHVQ